MSVDGPGVERGPEPEHLGGVHVHPDGRLALRKAVQAAYRLDHLPSPQEVLSIAEKWRPHRSLASSYLFPSPSSRPVHPDRPVRDVAAGRGAVDHIA